MRDITTIPFDYIVKHTKTENIVSQDKLGDYVCDIETEYIPLVRCKECKYWRTRDDGTNCCVREYATDHWRADDFCSYGEREGE